MRNRRLMKGLLSIFFGNFISKLSMFLLIPLLTRVFSPSEFGIYDALFSASLILVPIFSFQFSDAVFRYLLDCSNKNERRNIFFDGIIVTLLSLIITVFSLIVFNSIFDLEYLLSFTVYVSFSIVFVYLQQVSRGVRKINHYAISGIINSVTLLGIIILISRFSSITIDFIFYIMSFTNLLAILYLLFINRNLLNITHYQLKADNILKMLKYSLPLIPNTISWWLVSVANRFIIIYFLGLSFAGIFGVSSRYAGLLTFINGIFILAWQENEILYRTENDRKEYFKSVFQNYLMILVFIFAFATPIVSVTFKFLVSSEYNLSFDLIPFLFISAIINALASLYGVGYLSEENTLGAFKTTIWGALSNFVIIFSLINIFGIYSAIIASLGSSLVIFVIRYISFKNIYGTPIKIKTLLVYLIISVIILYVYFTQNVLLNIILFVIALVLFVKMYYKVVVNFFNKIKSLPEKNGGDLNE